VSAPEVSACQVSAQREIRRTRFMSCRDLVTACPDEPVCGPVPRILCPFLAVITICSSFRDGERGRRVLPRRPRRPLGKPKYAAVLGTGFPYAPAAQTVSPARQGSLPLRAVPPFVVATVRCAETQRERSAGQGSRPERGRTASDSPSGSFIPVRAARSGPPGRDGMQVGPAQLGGSE